MYDTDTPLSLVLFIHSQVDRVNSRLLQISVDVRLQCILMQSSHRVWTNQLVVDIRGKVRVAKSTLLVPPPVHHPAGRDPTSHMHTRRPIPTYSISKSACHFIIVQSGA